MQKTSPVPHPLHVVTMISNQRRYRSRYELYDKFAKHMLDSGVSLHTVEVAYGDRPFELTSQGEEIIQLRTNSEVWIKENAINIAIARLPADWKYVAWIDADIHFVRHDWAVETVHMLQHHPIVQCWSIAHDMSPDYENFQAYNSFAWCYQQFISRYPKKPLSEVLKIMSKVQGSGYGMHTKDLSFPHPGYAWAATRQALNDLGGLIDFAIVGSGDHHMALALTGRVSESIPGGISASYVNRLTEWQNRAEAHIKRNLGYVNGAIMHHWHGKKSKRGYQDRWQIVTRNHYDPDLDLKYDTQGLLQLTPRNFQLRDDLMHYFSSRNEDGIDME